MIEKITMPQLGESVTEGTITTWLKQPGDDIHLYEPICEVSTDKVNAEVPATVTGKLIEIIAAEGTTVAVGEIICRIENNGEGNNSVVQEVTQKNEDEEEAVPAGVTEAVSQNMKKRYSPAVLKLSQEHDIDLETIVGSGRGGRITRKDVLAYINNKKAPVAAEDQAKEPPLIQTNGPALFPEAGDREIPLTPVRRKIADRMVKSNNEVPHAWMMVEADVTELVRFRQRVKNEFKEREGLSLTYLPFFIKAVVESLKLYPRLNAVWTKDKIIEKRDINISVAVAGEESLYVPVIHKADRLSILGIAKSLNELVKKTAEGSLSVQDVEGGTFTVNNTGTFGSISSAPIINTPQAAIITIEAIVKRPVIIDNAIAIRDMVNFCLSLDHRILDGVTAGRFMQSVKTKMEAYGPHTELY